MNEARPQTVNSGTLSRIPAKARFPLMLIAVFVGLSAFVAAYYVRTYQGLITRDSMDVAQIARNISEGHGFTTRFVRPLNTGLMRLPSYGQMPEVNRAPLLPYAMSLFFRLRAAADQPAIWLTMCFALLSAIAIYLLGSLLFDWRAGMLSAVLFTLSPAALRAAVSGKEWTLGALLFTLLALAVAMHHRSTQGERRRRYAIYPTVCAALIAALYMTSHSLIFIAVPTAIYFWFTGAYRRLDFAIFVAAVVVTAGPWAVRNGIVSGIPILGATGWDALARTDIYPGDTLYRTATGIDLGLGHLLALPIQHFASLARKLALGIGDVGGYMAAAVGWLLLPFALVSVLYRFRNPCANAMRGWMYGVLAIMAVAIAIYSMDEMAMVVLAPVIAVLASAYFLLLLDAKKLHPFFARALVGGLIFFTAYPSLAAAAWRSVTPPSDGVVASAKLFTTPGFNVEAAKSAMYTDAPWSLAWRSVGTGVWLPRTDEDVAALDQAALPMQVVILTPESDSLPRNEIWYVLHKARIWREFLRSPKDSLREFLAATNMTKSGLKHTLSAEMSRSLQEAGNAAGIPKDEYAKLTNPEEFLANAFRNAKYPLSESLKGFATVRQNPLGPDDVQILVKGGRR